MFAQALVSLRRFRGSTEAEAVAWLYGIAHNLLRQYQRRQRVETSARKRLGMPVRDYAEYDEAEELADAQRLVPALEEALAGLPAHERGARPPSRRRASLRRGRGAPRSRLPRGPDARDARPPCAARPPRGSGTSLFPPTSTSSDRTCAAPPLAGDGEHSAALSLRLGPSSRRRRPRSPSGHRRCSAGRRHGPCRSTSQPRSSSRS